MKVRSRLIVIAAAAILIVIVLSFFSQPRHGVFNAGFDAEFIERSDGYPGLREHYGFEIPGRIRQMDPGLMYRAVRDGDVDVINAFATDGRIPAYDLVVLEDDLNFFPPYYAAPLVRKDTLEKHPALKDVLNMLGGRIDDETMQELNYRVDEQDESAREVAADFLRGGDLVGPEVEAAYELEGRIVVGGKHFTEQEILGEMVALLIEEQTDLEVERRLNLGGTMICFNALLAGDLDLYVEYTGTGLVNILDRDMIADPDEAYRAVQESFEEEYNLLWLDPLGFDNSYTLTMRREHARELGIETISDLARYIEALEDNGGL